MDIIDRIIDVCPTNEDVNALLLVLSKLLILNNEQLAWATAQMQAEGIPVPTIPAAPAE